MLWWRILREKVERHRKPIITIIGIWHKPDKIFPGLNREKTCVKLRYWTFIYQAVMDGVVGGSLLKPSSGGLKKPCFRNNKSHFARNLVFCYLFYIGLLTVLKIDKWSGG